MDTTNISTTTNNDPFLQEPKLSPVKRLKLTALAALAGSAPKLGFSDEFKSYESTPTSLRLSVVVVLAYVLVGSVTFSVWMEDWTVIDAMYFTSVTFTTVG